MSNAGIVTLCHLLRAPVVTKTLRVLKLGPPTDNGGELSDQAVQTGLLPLLSQPRRLEVRSVLCELVGGPIK